MSSAEAVQRSSAKVFIVVRRSNNFYCHNSEESQTWLPWEEGNVRPLFQHDESEAQARHYRGENTSASEVRMSLAACDDLTQIGGCQTPPKVIDFDNHLYHGGYFGTAYEQSNIEGLFPASLGKDVTHDAPLTEPGRRYRASPPIYGSKIVNGPLESSKPPIYDTTTASRRSGSSKPPIMRRFSAEQTYVKKELLI
ncbi:hypothetical protein ABVK25_010138 [Lepraria finkii]|uniref:Uncharacterized protein n=1 Tax=Lepraria finkii TaxID=1340010 RepID=A0ABR4AV48_9LECA